MAAMHIMVGRRRHGRAGHGMGKDGGRIIANGLWNGWRPTMMMIRRSQDKGWISWD